MQRRPCEPFASSEVKALQKAIQIHAADTVAVALQELAAGTHVSLPGGQILAVQTIPAGHKFALCGIKKGQDILKYGKPIGHAIHNIAAGDWVHTHNTATNLGQQLEYTYTPSFSAVPPYDGGMFMGYARKEGNAGIRNEVWIIPTVGCVNAMADRLAQAMHAKKPQGIDGIYAFGHPYGCSQLGEDHINTQRALAGLVRHPNAGAVLVLGLGCENNHIAAFQQVLGEYDPQRVRFLNAQSAGDEFAEGMELLQQLCTFAAETKRMPCSVSKLVVGLKCGGSDGFSGISANPLVGRFSDLLIGAGGSTILTEVPEMFGAETLLMERAVTGQVFADTVGMINHFKEYYQKNGLPVYENPSPGNKEGGITTLEDKSLGCTQKGGSAPVVDVLPYGSPLTKKGLNLLYAPGNDLIASSALTVSGAQLVLFTTGRGTPFGAPAPTVKISSNSAIAKKKPHWIDFDAGQILTGRPFDELAQELYRYVLAVASGQETNTEEQGVRELAIFKTGITL